MTFLQFIAAGIFLLNTAAYAQDQNSERKLSFTPVPKYSGWAHSFSLGSVSFDSEAAQQEGIDDQAFSLGLDAEYLWAGKPLSALLGFSWIGYSDDRKIVATTIGTGVSNNGDVRTQSSDASAIEIHGDYGYRHRFGPNNGGFVTARAGYLLNLFSERSISNCSDCPSQSIDIDGGAYGLVGVGINGGQTFSMGLNYKKFFTGDFDQTISVELRWSSF